MKRPKKGEYAPFHEMYLKVLPKRLAALTLLRRTFRETQQLLKYVPEAIGDYTYAPRKWTIKQTLMHLIDFERVFSFRLLSFMRADRIALPGFNQDFWMEEVDVSNRTIPDLLKEWKLVRENTIYLLRQCTEKQSAFVGTASGWKVTPRALFFIIIGHHIHHLNILREKYLTEEAFRAFPSEPVGAKDSRAEPVEDAPALPGNSDDVPSVDA
ncbi:MAG: DinB family protein [Bacteroidetes bacterium]|nr:MAG: DinB family protein [Bacteroidota bacterium]